MTNRKCNVCGRSFPENKLISGHGIRHEIESLIQIDYPDWNDNSYICQDDYKKYRMNYVSNIIEEESGHLENLEKEVVESIKQSEIISSDINKSYTENLTVGNRIADNVAKFGGSWAFIITFFAILLAWIVLNSILLLLSKPFDPYPFILLNLVLSCIAAIQAPIIMMSQNRQETKDRIRSENDYKVNLKSEIEIRTLHEKVDHLLLDQWTKMIKIQELQMELLEEIRQGKKN
jgi:uncharacterized membrane protein